MKKKNTRIIYQMLCFIRMIINMLYLQLSSNISGPCSNIIIDDELNDEVHRYLLHLILEAWPLRPLEIRV